MFKTEEKIRKYITTPKGEDEFQLRYIYDENVGLKRKCKCKNDFLLNSESMEV